MKGLNGNRLKLLALLTMTVDHIGVYLLPQYGILRIIGRLAFPIYAYFIAEGCTHTKNRKKYLLQMAGMALLCQLVYFFAMGSLFQCILVTFTLSILTICAIDSGSSAKAVAALCAVVLITVFLPQWLSNTDFAVDYSLWGVLLPVAVWLAKTRRHKLLCTAILLSMLALDFGGVQWYGLLALLPLSLYDGTRGSRRLKWLFYWYYPLHLAAIYGIGFLL
ncbi:MAG: hypothetical protein IKY86_01990 [Clostridia bacterium]|nr:hypothetical protein [Clostridia bacterium]